MLDVASGQTDLLQHQGHLGAGELFGLGPKKRKFSRRICFFSPIRLVATKLAVGSVPSRSRLTTRATTQPTPARRPSGHGQSAANETSLWKVSYSCSGVVDRLWPSPKAHLANQPVNNTVRKCRCIKNNWFCIINPAPVRMKVSPSFDELEPCYRPEPDYQTRIRILS